MLRFEQISVGLLVILCSALGLEKKILLHSEADILQRILHLEQRVQTLETENAVLKSKKGER